MDRSSSILDHQNSWTTDYRTIGRLSVRLWSIELRSVSSAKQMALSLSDMCHQLHLAEFSTRALCLSSDIAAKSDEDTLSNISRQYKCWINSLVRDITNELIIQHLY